MNCKKPHLVIIEEFYMNDIIICNTILFLRFLFINRKFEIIVYDYVHDFFENPLDIQFLKSFISFSKNDK